jgi:UbiD family decarboxylase
MTSPSPDLRTFLADLERAGELVRVTAEVDADLEVAEQERSFVQKMLKQLHLTGEDSRQVKAWLELPPKVEELDPNEVPQEQRKLFLAVARELIAADGSVSEEERENLQLLEQLLG